MSLSQPIKPTPPLDGWQTQKQKGQDPSSLFDVTLGKLHVVDLAGSERVFKSLEEDEALDNTRPARSGNTYVAHDAKTRREGRNINLSLHYLEQVGSCRLVCCSGASVFRCV